MLLPVGSAINAGAILLGAGTGLVLGSHLSARVKTLIYQALSLAIVLMGIKLAIAHQNVFLLTLSLVLGALTGAILGLHERLEGFALFVQKKMAGGKKIDENFAGAFITATSICCVGSMAVLGAVQEGITGEYSIFVVKAFMDMIIALNIASSQGKGALLAAVPVFIYQASLTFLASFLGPWLTGDLLIEFTAIGGALIAGVGASFLFPEKFRMLNILPAMVWVCILYPLFY